MERNTIKLVECPRDAMQGWKTNIPTGKKIEYINELLKVGFDTIDFGSFVSPKAIPQMADTREVLAHINNPGRTELLAIVANLRGAEEACGYSAIGFLGYPFSISETFQQRNTNRSINESFEILKQIQAVCEAAQKKLVVYISMGFGNPYGDPYSEKIAQYWIEKIHTLGISIISLADTVGLAQPEQIAAMTGFLIREFPQVETGVHLHATQTGWREKVDAAFDAGCRRFDGALKGIGGCPMANDELVGNLDTEWLIAYFREKNLLPHINEAALQNASAMAASIFQLQEPRP